MCVCVYVCMCLCVYCVVDTINSTAPDLLILLRALMSPHTSDFLNSDTVKLFTTEYNHTQSSRALGWNTNDVCV